MDFSVSFSVFSEAACLRKRYYLCVLFYVTKGPNRLASPHIQGLTFFPRSGTGRSLAGPTVPRPGSFGKTFHEEKHFYRRVQLQRTPLMEYETTGLVRRGDRTSLLRERPAEVRPGSGRGHNLDVTESVGSISRHVVS